MLSTQIRERSCSSRLKVKPLSAALTIILILSINFVAIPEVNAFSHAGSLTLNTGENDLWSAVIDSANGYAYFGTDTGPGIVVKVNLTDFTRVGSL
ncbi:hypothetical protein ACFLQ6_05475, partial [Thermoproteota archaeon]